MEKIVLLEPCISSLNLGDYIIVDSVKRELAFLLNDAFVVEQPTQTPIMHFYQKNDARPVSYTHLNLSELIVFCELVY